MRRKHTHMGHECQFCGLVIFGNGGYGSHMRKEYFERMPDMKNVKWISVKDLRREWVKRKVLIYLTPQALCARI